MKKYLFILVVSLILLPVTGCKQRAVAPATTTDKVVIYASFYPLYDFAFKIGGHRVEVVNMVPAGVEPHDWEPGPRLIADLHSADILVYNGFGFEPWVERIAAGLGNRPLLVDASDGITPITGYHHCNGHDHDDCDPDHTDYDHHYDLPDPHVWLDPLLALQQGENILHALVTVDPANEQYYRSNFDLFRDKLERLDADYRNALTNLSRREFVVTHLSFDYLARRYGLVQLGISGLSPHSEPTAAQMKDIVDFVRSHNIRYIFKEPLASPRLVRTLAEESGAQILTINPLEGLSEEDLAGGKDYFSIMSENLEQLLIALGE
jgi:zinc transport system substrate-binding protein